MSGERYVTQGEIAHIRAHSPEGPRYDPTLPREAVDSYDNTILLCREHHRLVDSDVSQYTVDILEQWKREHESASKAARLLPGFSVLTAPPLTQPHVGRPALAAQVLNPGSGVARVALVGVSGSGKTQLAVESLERADDVPFRWWLRGAETSALISDILRIGEFLGRDLTGVDPELAVREVRAHLEERADWLIVVDDLQDVALLELLPARGGLVIVTTQRAGALPREIPVPPLDNTSAEELLKSAPQIQAAEGVVIEAIAERCLGVPIVVAQVAAYSRATGMTAEAQLHMLEAARPALLARGSLPSHATLAASVEATLDRLSPQSRAILSLMSAFGEAPMPSCLVVGPSEGSDEQTVLRQVELEDAVAELRSYSLVERDGGSLTVHALIRELIRSQWMSGPVDNARYAAIMLASVFPDWPDRADNWPLMEELVPHALHLIDSFDPRSHLWLVEYATICNKVGVYFHSRGMNSQARELMAEAAERLRSAQECNEEVAGVLGSLQQNLANVMADLGETDLAVATMRESLQVKERVYGHEHELTAVAHSGLGNLLEYGSGDLVSARNEYEEALEVFSAVGRPSLIADALVDVARLTDAPEEALTLLSEAENLLLDDPEGWTILCGLYLERAGVLEAVGDGGGATREAYKAVKLAERYADSSKQLADAMAALGGHLISLDRFGAAVKYLRRSVEMSDEAYVSDIVRATRLGDLGLAMACAGEVEGIGLLERSLENLIALVGEEHGSVVTARRMLMQGLAMLGHYEAMGQYLEDVEIER